MKKFYFLFLLLWVGLIHSQCINTIPFGNIVSNNSGNLQGVTTCAYTGEYSVVSGLTIGANYLFVGQTGTTYGSGTHIYLTITDANNVVIQHGASPLLVNAITASTIRMHYTDNAACGQTSACHNGQVQLVLPCPAPISLTATSITSNSANLGWTALGTPTDFEVQWGSTGFVLGSGTIVTGLTANSYALSGLTPATTYQFYVRANCGTSEQSPWAGPFTFTTACVDFVPPTLETFTEVTPGQFPPSCWTRAQNGTPATGPQGGTIFNWFSRNWKNTAGTANGISANFNIYTTNRQGWLISPTYNLSAGGFSVFYDVATTGYFVTGPISTDGGNMDVDDEVYFLISTDNGATWTTLELFNQANTPSNAGSTKTYDITTINSATVKFAFFATSGPTNPGFADYDFFVDNFSVASCLPATNLNISGLTNTAVNLNWTASISNPANGYEWEIRTSGGAGSGATGLVQSGSVAAGITTVAISSLTPATVYQFYVRAICSTSDNSVWIQGPSFTSLCDLVTTFSQNFDNTTADSGILPPCWSRAGSSTIVNVVSGSNTPLSAPNRMQISAAFESTVAYALMPPVSNLQAETHRLRFRAFATSTGRNLEVGYFTDESDVNTFVPLENVPMPGTAQTAAEEFFIVPTGIPAGVTRLVFRNLPSASGTALIYIDDVVWQEIPNCLNPTLLSAGSITNVSAQLQWNANAGEVEWDIKYGAPGFNVQTEGTLVAGIFDNPYTLTGLTPNTTYSYYVRAVCDSSNSSPWEGPFTFTTLCDPYTIPYAEGFENGFTHNAVIAGCYSQVSVEGGSSWTANNTFTDFNRAPRTGAWNAFLQWGNTDWLFIPVQLTGGTSYTLQFYARQDGSTAANSNVSASFGVANNAAGMTNEIIPETGIVNGAYQEFIGNFTPSSTGIYFVGIRGFMNGIPWYISLDDISIIETPACPAPLGVTASIATNSSLDLSWTNQPNAANGYEWRVMVNGDDVNSGTPAASGTTAVGITTAQATGLTAGTTYQVYVRSVCDATTNSAWSSAFTIALDYCASVPISFDDQGITNVLLGATNFPTSAISYFNHSATVVDLQQGVTANVQVTFATGYTYNTNIWIDFNDNLVFEASELVYQGESLSTNPTTLNASFIMPLTAALGTHRMRIGTADGGQFTPDPCYSGSWGVTLDFAVNILPAPACPSPLTLTASEITSSSASLGWTSNASQLSWEIEYGITGFTQGTGTIVAASTNPFVLSGLAANTTYQFYVRAVCAGNTFSDWSLVGSFTTACSGVSTFPFNESFETTSSTYACWTNELVTGTANWTIGAGANGGLITAGYQSALNARFVSQFGLAVTKFVSPLMDLSTLTNPQVKFYYSQESWFGDQNELKVYYRLSPSSSWVEIAHYTSNVTSWTMVELALPNPSATYQIAFEGINNYGRANTIDDVTVEETLSVIELPNSQITYYPNPVKDVLNISNNSIIEKLEVFNLLGQKVMEENVNLTQANISMEQLSKGAYIVKAYADGAEHTFKIIKN